MTLQHTGKAAQHCAPADRLKRGHLKSSFVPLGRIAPHRRAHQPAAEARPLGGAGLYSSHHVLIAIYKRQIYTSIQRQAPSEQA
jgi:hypothetical protein